MPRNRLRDTWLDVRSVVAVKLIRLAFEIDPKRSTDVVVAYGKLAEAIVHEDDRELAS